MRTSSMILLPLALSLSVATIANAQSNEMSENKEVVMRTYETLQWETMGDEFPGVKVVSLRGDMTKGAYALYVELPAGFNLPLHHHENTEWGIIISGSLIVGLENGKETVLTPGSYAYFPKGVLHYITAGPSGCVFLEESNEKESTIMADNSEKMK